LRTHKVVVLGSLSHEKMAHDSVGHEKYEDDMMLLESISCARLFKRPSKRIAPFSTSTLYFPDIGSNCRPWMLPWQFGEEEISVYYS